MKRFFRKAAVWLARIAAVLIVLLILFYAEEDWRGARDWAACQKELQAKGETLDLRQLVPPGKPEDDLSKAPIFAPLYQKKIDENAPINQVDEYLKAYSQWPNSSHNLKDGYLDLASLQKFYRSLPDSHLPSQPGTPAQDVLQVLSRFDPQMNEIDAALRNPNAYWPIDYEKPFFSPLSGVVKMIRLAALLRLRAIAHLENHEPGLAEKDYLFFLRLTRPLTKGCILVNYLVTVGVRAIDDSLLSEGFHRHARNDAQLHEMESALASTDMLALAVDSFRTERASMLQNMKGIQGMNYDLGWMALLSSHHGLADLLLIPRIRPGGWWNEDRSTYSEGIQTRIGAIDLSRGTLSSAAFPHHAMFDSAGEYRAADNSTWRAIYTPMSAVALTGFDNMGSKIAKAETYRRLARLACRLEEYRIAHGQYPDKLDELPDLPAHLNQEVLSEQPLRYQRKGDGYLLYSIGWNQKDHGGVNSETVQHGNTFIHQDADWVWPSP